jgi:acyl-CoA synthetase (AMP-forming)/AMP-acid ligase II
VTAAHRPAAGAGASALGYADVLDRSARIHGDRVALVDGGRSMSHAELAGTTTRLAAALARRGLRRGDRMAVLAHNRFEILVCLGAAARLGASLVPVNWRLTTGDVAHVLADAAPRVAVVAPDLRDTYRDAVAAVAGLRCDAVALADGGGEDGDEPGVGAGLRFDDLVAEEPGDPPPPPAGEDDVLALMYTAAMSGRPLGAMMTQRAFVAQGANLSAAFGFVPGDVYVNYLPLFHTAGLVYTVALLQAGAEVHLMARFDAAAAARLVARRRVTVLAGTQPMGAEILEAARAGGCDLASLRLMLGREDPAVMRAYADVAPGVHWVIGNYGQTETHGQAVVGDLTPARDVEDAVPRGWETPLTAVRIADEDGRELPPGETGEILVKGPTVCVGYWGAAEANERVLRGGWWHTGDLGVRAGDGSIRFVARKPEKDLIKTGGENVYPAEVEAVLRRHPVVAEAVVLGIPDPRWRETVKAVVLAPGVAGGPAAATGGGTATAGGPASANGGGGPDPSSAALVAELLELCRRELAGYKKPRVVEVVADLPRRPDGLVDRAAVKARYGGVAG